MLQLQKIRTILDLEGGGHMGLYRDNIKNNIIKYRKLKGLTQNELAELLNVSKTAVSGWERGANAPDIETLMEICRIFKISVSEMYGVEKSIFTTTEIDLISKYRKLDSISKDIVNYIVDAELDRANNSSHIISAAARGNSHIEIEIDDNKLNELVSNYKPPEDL